MSSKGMQNNISHDQNTPRQLERLAAQRYLYSRAKNVLKLQTGFDLLTPIVIALLVAIFPFLDVYGAVLAVAVVVLDVMCDQYQSSRKKQAADIQEMFDCDVFGLECQELKVRRRPISEIIMDAAKRYKRADPTYATLKNWYPPVVERIPLPLARLVCQRVNCWWDAELRRQYARLVVVIVLLITLLVVLLSIHNGVTLGKFFLVIAAPLLPAYIWAVREYKVQSEAANDKEELRKYTEELWRKAMRKELTLQQLGTESRTLQDEIYNNRRTNPFILDWFYKRLRNEHEDEINRGAEELVEEALQSLADA
jgi:hypothetical protein